MLPYTTDTTQPKLTAAAKSSATEIFFRTYSNMPTGVDKIAELATTDAIGTRTLYKVTLTAGVQYDFISASFSDPKEMTIYDQFGNVLGVNDEGNDPNSFVYAGAAYKADAAYGVLATYSGVYYVETGWRQGYGDASLVLLDVISYRPTTKTYAPVARDVPNALTWKEGEAFSYTLPATSFSDPEGGKLTYYATLKDGSDLPSWMKLDSATGVFSGVAPAGTADLELLIFAKDEQGLNNVGAPLKVTTPAGAPVDTSPKAVLTTAFTNIMRYAPAADHEAFNGLVTAVVDGKVTMTNAIGVLSAVAASTTSVATLNYQFFTGKIPTQAGYDFLISPTGPNTTNLNSAYYATFDIVNRYINFAVNLGKNGEAKESFKQAYGNLTLLEATKEAYETIFGREPTDAKAHALIDTRGDYLAYYGGDGPDGIGTKAAMVGFLLAAAATEDVGMMAWSNDNFLFDLSDGANFGVNLVGTYGKPEYAYG